MAENKGFKGDEGGLDEEAEISSQKKQEDMVGEKSENPALKDSDADFEDLEDDGGGGNAVGDGLERLWTGLGSLLSRHNRWTFSDHFLFTSIYCSVWNQNIFLFSTDDEVKLGCFLIDW